MFDKVLVANRGEIACRIMATLRRMGVRSVGVYTDADAGSRHVSDADEVVRIGEGPVASSYLSGELILKAAASTGAAAIHPGYGFLSENADFAASCIEAGLAWIGPSPEQLRQFGDKHTARELALAAGLDLLAGSGLLDSVAAAVDAAEAIGFPVMLKATAGGGGIGMQRCDDAAAVAGAFDRVTRLATQHFGRGAVYLERFVNQARHIEVQIFGGGGSIAVLGVRDCSAQRRHQKVIEETPAWGLPAALESSLRTAAHRLASSVDYRSAGTVEFVLDVERGDAAFLEVNTRLQVEHGVTELVNDIDLVEWMVLEAAGEMGSAVDLAADAVSTAVGGTAIEVRVYAEDPAHDNRPGQGVLVDVAFPSHARVDTWVCRGTEITPWYDPLLAKILVRGPSRREAVQRLRAALDETRLDGVATNLAFLRDVVASPEFLAGGYSTSFLSTVEHSVVAFEVLAPGMQTTVQDLPGRLGYWAIGVPPSGPMDDRAFALGNLLVANDAGAAGLEITLTGPTLRFEAPAVIALTGAPMEASLDGTAVPWATAISVPRGAVLRIGAPLGGGCRCYLAIAGGLDVPPYLGSRATFMLGGFGGHGGRALATGDVLIFGAHPAGAGAAPAKVRPMAADAECDTSTYGRNWTITVTDGPHGAPDFFTPQGIDEFFAASWEVHHHSDRTGVRLIGPTPRWARADGGEAGLHPSNIHDTVYAVGTVDFTGDMPVILGPDGPSLGGFVCPVTVIAADRWKLGQVTAGDRVHFVRVPAGAGGAASAPGGAAVDPVLRRLAPPSAPSPPAPPPEPTAGAGGRPEVTYRRAGDRCILVEYGRNVLDIELRLRADALMSAVTAASTPGIEELAPGMRSLQVRYDPAVISCNRVVDFLESLEATLPDVRTMVVPSRLVRLPLSWDDPATRLATGRYMQVVRDDAPWCPWNIEFIRRINGLESVDDVHRIVFEASYLVLGLGDVYLGAPVATPLDPRHRLVTTKYNPARTWTAENSVGIGGAYLCVYGMEGPGGYQFVGRTIQMWNRYRETPDFQGSQRWLLRFFDQLQFFPVSAEELLDLRRDFAVGRYKVDICESSLSVADHLRFLDAEAPAISSFKASQQHAFDAERARWEASGEFTRSAQAASAVVAPRAAPAGPPLPDGAIGVPTPVNGVVARVAGEGETVEAGDAVVVVEAMKTETAIATPAGGTVTDVRCRIGDVVGPGTPLVVITPAAEVETPAATTPAGALETPAATEPAAALATPAATEPAAALEAPAQAAPPGAATGEPRPGAPA